MGFMNWLRDGTTTASRRHATSYQPQLASWTPPARLAVEIGAEEIKTIEMVVREADAARRRARFHLDSPSYDHTSLLKALYMRVGAASAVEDELSAVPLYEHEISDIERMIGAMRMDRANAQITEAAQQLLNKLHALLGRSRAIRELGGVPVFTHHQKGAVDV